MRHLTFEIQHLRDGMVQKHFPHSGPFAGDTHGKKCGPLIFLWQVVWQIAPLPVTWDVTNLMWCYCSTMLHRHWFHNYQWWKPKDKDTVVNTKHNNAWSVVFMLTNEV